MTSTDDRASLSNGASECNDSDNSIQEVNSSADEGEELNVSFGTNDATDEKRNRSPVHAENGHSPEFGQKRSRKIVQRLSETWNKAHVAQVEQRAEAVKQINASFEAGRGVELGSIPLIEASLRKTKPVNLKPLHFMIYGRYGAASEVRSNIRKFRGFAFRSGSPEYTKKLSSIQQRHSNEIREVLRLLHLEVSGTRQVMSERLMEFLIEPKATKVKYKGQVVRKSRKSHRSSVDHTGGKKRVSSKSPSSKTGSSEISTGHANRVDEDDVSDNADSLSSGDAAASSDEEHAKAIKPPEVPRKRGRPRKNAIVKHAESSASDSISEPESAPPPKKRVPKRAIAVKRSAPPDSDEDVPLSSLVAPKRPTPPTDSELKANIIALLKTVNLEETSLKVVREQIFAQYPGVDLTDKREFINTTVKEYLSQS